MRNKYWKAAALVGLVVVVFFPSIENGFIWDDEYHALDKEALQGLDGLRRIWFEVGSVTQYYPLSHSVFWLEYRLWGATPLGYHVMNILLHSAVASLLFLVLQHLGVRCAWVAAAVFALHPVQVESVAWISEHKNLLSGACYFGSALLLLRWVDRVAVWTRSCLCIGILLFVCAVLCKTVTASLPAALLLIIWCRDGRLCRRHWVLGTSLFIAALPLGLLTIWTEKTVVGADYVDLGLSGTERILIAGRAVFFYLGKLLWPFDLAFAYPRWRIDAGAWWQFLFPGAAIALVGALILLRKRLGRVGLASTLFFGGTLLPALGFFDVYPFLYSFVADHYQYLASTGVIVPVVIGGWTLLRTGAWFAHFSAGLATVVLLALGILSWNQCFNYRSPETLWKATLKVNPDSFLALQSLGMLEKKAGNDKAAARFYRRALAIEPVPPDELLFQSHYHLGSALVSLNRLEEGVWHYRKAAALRPGRAYAYNAIGVALKTQGRLEEAVSQYQLAQRINPGLYEAHENLGVVRILQKRYDDAIRLFRKVADLAPDHHLVHHNWAVALAAKGDWKEALRHIRRSRELSPPTPDLLRNWAWLFSAHPDAGQCEGELAVEFAEEALESNAGNPELLDALAIACAAARQFDRAVLVGRQGLSIALAARNDSLAGVLRSHIDLFEREQPYRANMR